MYGRAEWIAVHSFTMTIDYLWFDKAMRTQAVGATLSTSTSLKDLLRLSQASTFSHSSPPPPSTSKSTPSRASGCVGVSTKRHLALTLDERESVYASMGSAQRERADAVTRSVVTVTAAVEERSPKVSTRTLPSTDLRFRSSHSREPEL